MRYDILEGDNVDIMPTLPAESFDSLVTDPPAGVSFMGKAWDSHSTYAPATAKGRAVLESMQSINLKGWEAGFVTFTADWAAEALRLLKPGAFGVVWALPRTADLTGLGLRAAGFEIRNSIHHIFGSGFPKSLNVSKAIDGLLGAKRTVVGTREQRNPYIGSDGLQFRDAPDYAGKEEAITAAATPEAVKWEGWGTDLKPSHEAWILVRKPLSEDTVAENLLKRGVGAVNIDRCRVAPTGEKMAGGQASGSVKGKHEGWTRPWMDDPEEIEAKAKRAQEAAIKAESLGRFPPNLVLTHHADCRRVGTKTIKGGSGWAETGGSTSKGGILNQSKPIGARDWSDDHTDENGLETVEAWEYVEGCPVLELDRQSGVTQSKKAMRGTTGRHDVAATAEVERRKDYSNTISGHEDAGGASRFFPQFAWTEEDWQTAIFLYTAKASRGERNAKCEDLDSEATDDGRAKSIDSPYPRGKTLRKNTHPTVKPIELMKWLCRLTCPPGGHLLDPFAGSGTTGKSAALEGFDCTLIERDADYVKIMRARLNGDQQHFNFGS